MTEVKPQLGGFADDYRHPWGFKSAEQWEKRDEMVPMWTPEDVEKLRERIFRQEDTK